MKEKQKNITFGSHEDEYEYWDENHLKKNWTNIKKRLEEESQLSSWKLPKKQMPTHKIKYEENKQKSKKYIPQPPEQSIIQELKRRKQARNAKREQLLNKQHQKNKKLKKKLCVDFSLRKSYSYREQKKQKVPLKLSCPKSYYFPTLRQSNSFFSPQRQRDEVKKSFSPENYGSKFLYARNSDQRKQKLKNLKKEGQDHVVWDIEDSPAKFDQVGLIGVLKKIKNNNELNMKKNEEFEDLALRTCLTLGKKEGIESQLTFFN